jgi:hypothetical protein
VITGDDTAETITIGIDNGLLTHNFPTTGTGFADTTDFDSDPGVIKTLPAGTGTLEIDAKGGDDTQDGGEGNDVFIWNNRDGTDTTDGDAGSDEQVSTGATRPTT